MSTTNLNDVILDGGLASVNFFNGRLLSGEDLTQEQSAQRRARQRLGLAAGDGIAFGLGVAATLAQPPQTGPVLAVGAGLAINRLGQTLALTAPAVVALARPPDGGTVPADAGAFAACQPFQGGVYVTGTGVYLLVLSPGSRSQGRVPVSGLGNVDPTCNTRYTVEGIRFRLLELPLSADELSDASRLRNLVAYKCFGIADDDLLTAFHANPFAPPLGGYGLLDALRTAGTLTDADVPLAVVSWTDRDGVTFVDPWSVRRRVTAPAVTAAWGLAVGDRRRAEAEAMFLQFQHHLEDLRIGAPNPETLVAAQYFRYLPPAGLLPLAGVGALRGFSPDYFFYQRATRAAVFMEGAGLECLLHTALDYPPIDLAGDEMVFLYLVRENQNPRDFKGAAAPPAYLVFTSGHVPFRGQGLARYDVARFDYSNYVSALALPE
jgi:hypothetical protein